MKKQKRITKLQKIIIGFVVAVMLCLPIFATRTQNTTSAATIDELRQQANDLQGQIDANNAEAEKLAQQSDSLKKKIAEYDLQINQIDTQINLISVKLQQLDQELAQAQKDLDYQKDLLKASLTELYKRGGASTIELLIGSDSFSQFINNETYLDKLKNGIQTSAEAIITLKQQIQAQQTEQTDLLRQQEDSRRSVASAKSQRQSLLVSTQGRENNYRQVSSELVEKQKELLAQIVAQSRVITNVGTGSYPWADFMGDAWNHWDSCGYSGDGDPWGYCLRQCVSYVAWKLYATGHNPPSNYGNAADWMWRTPVNQRGYTPQVGAVAVWGGYWGHVAYVEEVYGDGDIRISEYNAVPALQGRYSQRVLSADNPSIYLYF